MSENGQKIREDIDNRYKWDLTQIFESNDEWEKDYKFIEDSLIKYSNYHGKIAESAEEFRKCIGFDEYIKIKLEKLGLYSFLSKDLDLANTTYQSMDGRIHSLYSKVKEASAFIIPEILSIEESKLWSYLEEIDELKVYKHFLENVLRQKENSLDKEKEELLAISSPALSTAYDTFSLFKNADLEFPSVEDENGEEIKITEGLYYSAIYSTDRDFRERVYRNYYKPYKQFRNTLSATFNGNLKAQIFRSKARKYSSTREAALKPNNIPLSVYGNLINTVNENVSALHRWGNIKRRVLGYDEMHPYDFYVTLFPNTKDNYSYDQAVEMVTKSLEPMGHEYLEALEKAFTTRKIDVYESKGKRSGAYSSGVTYGVDPYVLMNWTSTLNDVSTLTHEMGHNMHSYFTGKTQPSVYAGYPIFLAEVASITNENLLHEYLINKAESKEEKLSLIEMYLNKITSTFFRQTQFAEYEQAVHERTEAGESLTPDSLCELYENIFKKYYGPNVICDEEETYTWSRVPHFYYGFYVYQYATGLAAAEFLSDQILREGMVGSGKMMRFLKAGNSKYPIDVLKDAGVDMESPEPVNAVINKMNSLMDQFEEMLGE